MSEDGKDFRNQELGEKVEIIFEALMLDQGFLAFNMQRGIKGPAALRGKNFNDFLAVPDIWILNPRSCSSFFASVKSKATPHPLSGHLTYGLKEHEVEAAWIIRQATHIPFFFVLYVPIPGHEVAKYEPIKEGHFIFNEIEPLMQTRGLKVLCHFNSFGKPAEGQFYFWDVAIWKDLSVESLESLAKGQFEALIAGFRGQSGNAFMPTNNPSKNGTRGVDGSQAGVGLP